MPVPSEVLRLGFVDYVTRLKELGYQTLFPELHAPGRANDTGDRFYKSFMPLLNAESGFNGEIWERTLHALRHGFSDKLKQEGRQLSTIEDITGHLGRAEGKVRYTNAAGIRLMQKALESYPIISDHLESQPVHLLPFVENKQPAPWFRKPKVK